MSLPIPLLWKLRARLALSPCSAPTDFPPIGPRLIVALAADYGNLGDVALTRALIDFCARNLPTHSPWLLTAGKLFRELRGASRHTGPNDIVVIVGGGNMGDLYRDLEEARLLVVRSFPNNRIISFPQSVGFSNNTSGRRALARSKKVYEAHKHLKIFARDAESLRQMLAAFPAADVSLAPDTVLSMSAPLSASRDIPLMVCLRQDKEAGVSVERRAAILNALQKHCPAALVTDTQIPGTRLNYQAYEHRLVELLDQFAKSRCVVTDRLHGLIFAVITETPCVVIENNNHKIRALVDTWLKGMSSVRLLTNPMPSEVIVAADEVSRVQAVRPDLSNAFATLASALKG